MSLTNQAAMRSVPRSVADPLGANENNVTGTLQVKFVKPVPVERPLLGYTRVVGREGRRVFVEAELQLAGPGIIVASAEAIMVRRPADHFDRHDEWLRGLDAAGGDR